MRVAIIPARGGSKRIPRKNIRDFCGRPMLAWPLQAARASQCFERIIVSTDDAEIADVARAHGAEVPFLRPPELADDHATTTAVIAHAIRWLQAQGAAPVDVCCIYATAPLLQAADLQRGLGQLHTPGTRFAFAVTDYAFPIQRAVRLRADGHVEMFAPAQFATRSQDLEPAFHDAGQFYWGRAEAWLGEELIFAPHSAAVLLPRARVQDIDTPEDWAIAERMFRNQLQAG